MHKVWFLCTTQLLSCPKCDYCKAVIMYKVWLLYIIFMKETITFCVVRLDLKSRKMYSKTYLYRCYLVQNVIIVQLLSCTKCYSEHSTAVMLYKVWLLYSFYFIQIVIAVHNLFERNNYILWCKIRPEK